MVVAVVRGWQRDMMDVSNDKISNRSYHPNAKFWSEKFEEKSTKHMNKTTSPDQFIFAAEIPHEPTGGAIAMFSPAYIDEQEGKDKGFTIRSETWAQRCNA